MPRTTTITVSGARVRSREPIVVPVALPIAAAPATRPSATVSSSPPTGFSRSRNARNISRKPEKARSAPLARSAMTTADPTLVRRGIGPVSSSDSVVGVSPSVESTLAGSRSASTMPAPNTRKAARSDHAGPISDSSPARPAPSVPATMPASEMRALTLDQRAALGQQPGDRGRPGDAVGLGRRPGRRRRPGRATARRSRPRRPAPRWRSTGRAWWLAMAYRRPCRNRSSSGPMIGAITANGAIVMSR